MKKVISFTKKDFKIEWFSGTGAGGQHRNKHQNCCRMTHIPTGLSAQGTSHRNRESNRKEAFENLAIKLILWYKVDKNRYNAPTEVVRTYNQKRNMVKDHRSGKTAEYDDVLYKNGLNKFMGLL